MGGRGDRNNGDAANAAVMLERLRRRRPATRGQLRDYVKVFLGLAVPDRAVCEGHCAPLDYLWHAWSVDDVTACDCGPDGDARRGAERGDDSASRGAAQGCGDAVVWANRGGGKTELAAVATVLDCVFKPGCRVRILGGSLEQSACMYRYLAGFLERGYGDLLAGPIRKERLGLVNGSEVQILPQSERAVRGQHVHKLRCDELELFDAEVLAGAMFTTHSTGGLVGTVEQISTMHRPYGLMHAAVRQAGARGVPVFRWCVWEVIERCQGRSCSRCVLSDDCQGRARRGRGYLRIDDVIAHRQRSSRAGFEAEMLCRRPSLDRAVFAEFDPAVHVGPVGYDPTLPLYRAIDFGFVHPFVCLWVQVDGEGRVRVIDEYVRSRATIAAHAEAIRRRTPCEESQVAGTFCDPAGAGRNDVTGTSAVAELAGLGIRVRYRRSGILEGIEQIRRALRAGDGRSRLVIDPRCVRLIEAMQGYHYPDSAADERAELPVKDGVHDHPIDALRYFFAGVHRGRVRVRRY